MFYPVITLLSVLHWLCGLVVVAEALNKLERTAPCMPGLAPRTRLVAWLKAIAWGLLALGGAGALVAPWLRPTPPTLADVCVIAGFTFLIIRTRFKEGSSMKLTEHFTLAELVASSTARKLGIDNTPSADALQQLHRTAQMLERVRKFLGGHAVIVTSGYRNRQVNAAVGGVSSSDHAQGMAADVKIPTYGTPYEVAKALAPQISALGIGQIIYESVDGAQWVHLSTRIPLQAVNRVITVHGKTTLVGVQQV